MASTHRIANLVAILLPFAGLVLGIALLWGWGLSWIHLVLLFGMYLITGLGVTIGFHRLFTHKSFETGPVLRAVFGVLGSMSVQGPVMAWVSHHRCHHQHSDTEGDPHTPHGGDGSGLIHLVKGFCRAHIGWMMMSTKSETNFAKYIPDLQKDRLVRWISRLFPLWVLISLLIPTVIAGLVTMTWTGALLGLVWGGLVRIFMVHHITWSVNSVCHIWGNRPFQSHDESRNNAIVGVLAFGEGWHNNHHAFPTSARHGLRWWQFDLSYVIIRALEAVGLIWNVRIPTPERIAAKRI